MARYAIVNSSNIVTNVVKSDTTPEFVTSSGDYYIEITDSYSSNPPTKGKRYHQSSDKFISEPQFYIIYADNDANGLADNIITSDEMDNPLEIYKISGSIHVTASWSSDLVSCDESSWEVTNATISDYSFNANTDLSKFTLTANDGLNDNDLITLTLNQTVTDTLGFTWDVNTKHRYLYTSSVS